MNRKPLFIIFGLILTLIASACNLPSPTPGPTFTPGPTHITPLAATDTPLVPLPPTSTVPSVSTPTNTIGPTPTGPRRYTEAIISVIHQTRKPVIVALMGENLVRRAADLFRAARIPDYRFPERAASALAMLARRAETLARPSASPAPCTGWVASGSTSSAASFPGTICPRALW